MFIPRKSNNIPIAEAHHIDKTLNPSKSKREELFDSIQGFEKASWFLIHEKHIR